MSTGSENTQKAATNKAVAAGLSKEVQRKVIAKRSKYVESELLKWIFAVVGEKKPDGQIEDVLHDGTTLCKLINKILPGFVIKIHSSDDHYKKMENINNFLEGCRKYGVHETDLFQTVDLYEKKDIVAVTNCFIALERATTKDTNWKGPNLDVDLSL